MIDEQSMARGVALVQLEAKLEIFCLAQQAAATYKYDSHIPQSGPRGRTYTFTHSGNLVVHVKT